ncbi:MAG: hypothetical protein AVDCRST_MAG17-979, partial [uncultured Solirubrobacterales bacterium]
GRSDAHESCMEEDPPRARGRARPAHRGGLGLGPDRPVRRGNGAVALDARVRARPRGVDPPRRPESPDPPRHPAAPAGARTAASAERHSQRGANGGAPSAGGTRSRQRRRRPREPRRRRQGGETTGDCRPRERGRRARGSAQRRSRSRFGHRRSGLAGARSGDRSVRTDPRHQARRYRHRRPGRNPSQRRRLRRSGHQRPDGRLRQARLHPAHGDAQHLLRAQLPTARRRRGLRRLRRGHRHLGLHGPLLRAPPPLRGPRSGRGGRSEGLPL